jgi:hypothetical protein
MVYQWCHCYEDVEHIACNDHAEGKCSTVTDEPVRLYCYCRYHASNKWNSVNKAQKKQAKLEKKKLKDRDIATPNSDASTSSSSPRNSVNSSLESSPISSTNNSATDVTAIGSSPSPSSRSRRRLSRDWVVSKANLWRRSS